MPLKGYKQTEEHRLNNSLSKKGRKSPCGMLGRKQSEETRKKMSLAHMGNKSNTGIPSPLRGIKRDTPAWNKGIKLTEEHKAKLRCKRPSITGENNYQWIEDRTVALEKHRMRSSEEWKNWRKEVFGRDNFTCMECGDSGVYIEPHHIIPLKSGLSGAYDTDNGITLCRPCHKLTMGREADFIDKYSNIINSKK